MLGRGILACPDLARQINAEQLQQNTTVMQWPDIVELLAQFCVVTEEEYEPKYVGNRVKQWLGYLRRQYPMAEVLFEEVKRLKWPEEIAEGINRHKNPVIPT